MTVVDRTGPSLASGGEAAGQAAAGPALAPKMPPSPRSDIGTIVLHWLVTTAVIASLVTGLRLSADEGSWFANAIEII
ncbi:hypothetical protein J8J27_31105, partial [Mycobacterium tuberculosis]|nr:hypothetical protein [Mycobacterium tuberculosis]